MEHLVLIVIFLIIWFITIFYYEEVVKKLRNERNEWREDYMSMSRKLEQLRKKEIENKKLINDIKSTISEIKKETLTLIEEEMFEIIHYPLENTYRVKHRGKYLFGESQVSSTPLVSASNTYENEAQCEQAILRFKELQYGVGVKSKLYEQSSQ